MVLAEQPDKKKVIKIIAHLLQRLAKLYQLPNWTEDNAVTLSEWVYDNYRYDSLQDVMECLKNPPPTGQINWRLTPDTIRTWMEIQLEKTAAKREKEISDMKARELGTGPIENVDYESFKQRVPDFIKKQRHTNANENEYQRFRLEYLEQRKQQQATEESK